MIDAITYKLFVIEQEECGRSNCATGCNNENQRFQVFIHENQRSHFVSGHFLQSDATPPGAANYEKLAQEMTTT
jgi:hypothetical protein